MNIGQKIKTLRIAKMMTQQELAGDNITRNMLSRIENGFALPSLQTLMYISEKLGVPAGYLLANDEEDFGYKKLIGMPEVMRAFHAGEWQICVDLCLSLGNFDDEVLDFFAKGFRRYIIVQTDESLPSAGTPFVVRIASVNKVIIQIGMFRPFRYYGADGERLVSVVTVVDFLSDWTLVAENALGSPSGDGHFVAI